MQKSAYGYNAISMTQNKSRFLFIDLCRGFLVFMMTARHTISILGIPSSDWLYQYFLPKGWATVCFISLSGFSIGILYLERIKGQSECSQIRIRLRKRGWQLLVVMFVSNAFMLVSESIVRGDYTTLVNVEWWLGLLTLETPYSISSILIPTALLVFISPEFLKSIVHHNVKLVLLVCIILAFLTAMLSHNISESDNIHYLVRRLLIDCDGFFAILPMLLYGLISICIGSLWRKSAVLIIVMTLIMYYGLVWMQRYTLFAEIAFEAINGPARLIIIILVCLVLIRISVFTPLTKSLSTIGRYSLLSFLLHRILLQGLVVIANKLPSVSRNLSFFMFVTANMVALWLVSFIRLHNPAWDNALRRIYL